MRCRTWLAIVCVVGFVLAAQPVDAQVVLDANATADCTSNAVTTKDCATLTVGSGSNRALVCQIAWSGSNSAITLTWDQGGTNQAMTLITGATATAGTNAKSELYGLVAPTSGAKTLRASWTTSRDVVINCVAWTGVDQTGGATTFPNGTGATGLSATPSVTVTSAANDMVMGVHTTDGSMSSVNQTQTYLDTTPSLISSGGNRAAGAASVVMSASTSANNWASAGASIKAASGGGGAAAKRLMTMGVGVPQ